MSSPAAGRPPGIPLTTSMDYPPGEQPSPGNNNYNPNGSPLASPVFSPQERRGQDRGYDRRNGNRDNRSTQGNHSRYEGSEQNSYQGHGYNRSYNQGRGYRDQKSPGDRHRSPDYQYPNQGGRPDYGTPYRNRRDDDGDVFLSKTLSSILRHNAERFGFKLMKGGFLYVDEILRKTVKLHGFRAEDVVRVVDSNDKKRFTIEEEENGRLKIRANQGHSVQVDDLELTPITSTDDAPAVIHGTYYTSWELIQKSGLCRMNRNHIHFAVGEPGENEVISGMRTTCEVIIYIDMEKALKDGVKFFRSANNVILSPGNEDGIIYPCYFQGVLDRRQRFRIPFDATISSGKRLNNDDSQDKKSKKRKKGKSQNKTEASSSVGPNTPSPKKQNSRSEAEDSHVTSEGGNSVADKNHAQEDNQVQVDDQQGPVSPGHGACSNSEIDPPKTEVKATWNEPVLISDVAQSLSAVDTIMSDNPDFIVVCCCGEKLGEEGSRIRLLVILAQPHVYMYHLHDEQEHKLVEDGNLNKLLLDKKIKKVFHDIEETSTSLIREFSILLNRAPIWDVAMMYEAINDKITHDEWNDLENVKFSASVFSKWKNESEELGQQFSEPALEAGQQKTIVERGKLMFLLYTICVGKINGETKRKLRRDIYDTALPKVGELAQKVKDLEIIEKEKEKAEKSKKAATKEVQKTVGNSGKSHKKGKKK